MLWENVSDEQKKSILEALKKTIRMFKIKSIFNVNR
jgi:hypothetical protein